ncbi:hypothetical protein N9X40_00930 [bacterium]|nr:hypothetical protein [bacterium]
MTSFRVLILLCAVSIVPLTQLSANDLPSANPIPMKLVGKMNFAPIVESSGIVRSKLWPDWLWTHNDSGDSARIFAVRKSGTIIKPTWAADNYQGLEIKEAANIDWEDIATDESGNLIIAACGNNSNARRDLAIYVFPEPNATQVIATRTFHRYDFIYPDQLDFPPLDNNYDCEAIFFARGKIYILTKHRADTHTKLYRFDSLDPIGMNVPTMIGEFDVQGRVTGADVSEDGTRLAVLTYRHVWLFKSDRKKDNYFEGSVYWAPLNTLATKNCESLCFWDEDSLLIGNEERELYEIKASDLLELQL